jgi:hypothetical protein
MIAQPSREVKILQWFLIEHFLEALPVHRSAMGYVHGRNIRDNAREHQSNDAILKLDFIDFFHSITPTDWATYVRKNRREWNTREYLPIMTNILFWGRGGDIPTCLSIGAPSSPALSNILMCELDVRLFEEAVRRRLSYTRYADDITVSGQSIDALIDFEKFVRKSIVACKSPRLRFNDEKRGIFTKGQRRLVTGLIVTPAGGISIGRQRKRMISSLLHRLTLDNLDISERGLLKGMLGFAIANEPEFVGRLRQKYGNDVVKRALTTELPRKGGHI